MRNWKDKVVKPVLRPAARCVDAPRSTARASRFRLHAPRSLAAFTLVELMTVILVIGIVSGIVISAAGYAQKSALKSRSIATIRKVTGGLERLYADRGWYPPDLTCTTDTYVLIANQCVWPCESLWFWLEYWGPHQGTSTGQAYSRQPYCVFKRDEVSPGTTKINARYDQTAGNFMRVVDAWGNPLNYKSYNGNSYKFNDGTFMPRHNNTNNGTTSVSVWGQPCYDICSYGADGTTWSDRNKSFDRQQDLSLSQMRSVTDNGSPVNSGQIPNYFFKPFDTVVTTSAGRHCFGGEDNDDINNWQQ